MSLHKERIGRNTLLNWHYRRFVLPNRI